MKRDVLHDEYVYLENFKNIFGNFYFYLIQCNAFTSNREFLWTVFFLLRVFFFFQKGFPVKIIYSEVCELQNSINLHCIRVEADISKPCWEGMFWGGMVSSSGLGKKI